MEEKIKQILLKELPWIFCDTCANEQRGDCKECNKELLHKLNWMLSDEAAEEIAQMIKDIMECE